MGSYHEASPVLSVGTLGCRFSALSVFLVQNLERKCFVMLRSELKIGIFPQCVSCCCPSCLDTSHEDNALPLFYGNHNLDALVNLAAVGYY